MHKNARSLTDLINISPFDYPSGEFKACVVSIRRFLPVNKEANYVTVQRTLIARRKSLLRSIRPVTTNVKIVPTAIIQCLQNILTSKKRNRL
jgi:hypothetical protein